LQLIRAQRGPRNGSGLIRIPLRCPRLTCGLYNQGPIGLTRVVLHRLDSLFSRYKAEAHRKRRCDEQTVDGQLDSGERYGDVDSEGKLTDEKTREFVGKLLRELEDWTRRLSQELPE